MAFFLSPVLNEQQFDANGDPRAGALITTYLAETLTLVTTYKTSTGTAHTNPIALDSSGNYPNGTQLWLLGGLSYKFVITDADGSNSRTYDNITGVGDDLSGIDQWIVYSAAPTYISATSFSLAGDQTNIFQINRRVRTVNNGGTIYSTISGSSFGAGITTVTVVNDSGVLDVGLSQVSYGLLTPQNSALPPASATTTGGVELATTAEALAGTDTTRAVTPAGLATTRRLVQRQRTNVTAVISGTATTIPVDTSVPQITEGTEMMTLTITPTVVGSTIVVSASAAFGMSAPGEFCTMALFRDAVANALDAKTFFQTEAQGAPGNQLTNHYELVTASLTAITFRIRAGSSAGATPYMNGSNTATLTFGGVSNSYIIAEEYLP